MIDEIRICAKPDCDIDFHPKSHNQIYCSKEHQRIETNLKIMIKYYKNKERRAGKVRHCTICKYTKLSQYNNTEVCSLCEGKADRDRTKEALEAIQKMVIQE